jgi:hypothetical protein
MRMARSWDRLAILGRFWHTEHLYWPLYRWLTTFKGIHHDH